MSGGDSVKVFNDPVHGTMEFHPLCVAIIDTPEFQRLRYLKQLGAGYFVYPGACHNRFEHSLGVCHLAGQLVKRLQEQEQNSDLDITPEDVLCVQIAGLCHDLGHGPFSHVFDNSFIPRAEQKERAKGKGDKPQAKKWKHEDASIAMFDHMVKNVGLKDCFEAHGICEPERKFIKQLIKKREGEKLYYESDHKKAFLYEIVANERNGVDVDKWDYFKRDSLQLGMGHTFDHNRFILFAKVIQDKGQWQICVRDKEVFNMYQMFLTRFSLHRRAYQHRVVQAVEIMLVDAMLEYDDYLEEMGQTTLYDCIAVDRMDEYINLTDAVFHDILRARGESPSLKNAQDILMNIQRRKLYPCVGESALFTSEAEEMTADQIEKEFLEYARNEGGEVTLDKTHFAIQFLRLDFGRKSGEKRLNPVDDIRFYSKRDPEKAVSISASEVSFMIPQEAFQERQVRVFLRASKIGPPEKKRAELLQAALKKWSEDHKITKGMPKIYPLTLTP